VSADQQQVCFSGLPDQKGRPRRQPRFLTAEGVIEAIRPTGTIHGLSALVKPAVGLVGSEGQASQAMWIAQQPQAPSGARKDAGRARAQPWAPTAGKGGPAFKGQARGPAPTSVRAS
jgi:hypothetical protein